MKNENLGNRVKELRSSKGFSQEYLADEAKLSLRTIQRIESGITTPRGDTFSRLATALQVSPDEIIDWTKKEDRGLLTLLNISALSFLINPLFGIIIPLALWVSIRDKVKYADEMGRKLLNFQISLIAIFSIIILILFSMILNRNAPGGVIFWIFGIIGFYYLFNIIMILTNIIRVQKRLPVIYKPVLNIIR